MENEGGFSTLVRQTGQVGLISTHFCRHDWWNTCEQRSMDTDEESWSSKQIGHCPSASTTRHSHVPVTSRFASWRQSMNRQVHWQQSDSKMSAHRSGGAQNPVSRFNVWKLLRPSNAIKKMRAKSPSIMKSTESLFKETLDVRHRIR